jgi:Glycosyl transferases group 1
MTREILTEHYNNAVSESEAALHSGDVRKSIAYAQFAGRLAWMTPFLKSFSDDNMERVISSISKKFDPIDFIPQEDRIVFYNGQIVDSGALTGQYLDFFIAGNFQVLFIVPSYKNTLLGKSILQKIGKAHNIELYVPESSDSIEKVKGLRKKIALFQAKHCFLHFLPNDVIGCLSFLNIADIRTYYIVHNDHTFWVGKNYFNYYIEFRNFGISLDIERRGIPLKKILHIPYYPIRNDEPFKGFPFDKEGKIIGLSGANLYKYLADPELKYFHIIKVLLNENPQFIFCLCGWGNEKAIIKFIQDNNLQERFYFLGKRSDFYSLVGNSDILFESYPMKGGLTPLYATEQKIPVVGIASYDNGSGSLEDLLGIEGYKQPANPEEFKRESEKLIRSSDYRKQTGEVLSKNRYNKHDFEAFLRKVFDKDLEDLRPQTIKPLKLNDDSYLQEFLNISNSSVENLMRTKLFALKSDLTFFSRLKLLSGVIQASDTKGLYGMLRVLIIVIFGR